MPTKKISQKSKCAPAIWKQFNRTERVLWNDLYRLYLLPENFHTDWTDKKFAGRRHVVAHNIACETVWYLQEYGRKFFPEKKAPSKKK